MICSQVIDDFKIVEIENVMIVFSLPKNNIVGDLNCKRFSVLIKIYGLE